MEKYTVFEALFALISLGFMVWAGWSLDVAGVVAGLKKELLLVESEIYHVKVARPKPLETHPETRVIEWRDVHTGQVHETWERVGER